MRIAHVIWSLRLGGAEAMLLDIVNRQAAQDTVLLCVINAECDPRLIESLDRRVTFRCLHRPPGSANPAYFLALNATLWAFRPDIAHAHRETLSRVLFVPFARKVITIHDTGIDLHDADRRYDAVYSISEAVRQDMADRGCSRRSIVVENGIDFDAVRVSDGAVRKAPFRIVQVSRLVPEKKGQDVLLHACRLVRERLGDGSITVDFIGEGPGRDELERLAQSLRIGDICRFVGAWPRDAVYRRLCEYNLLIQPSRYEGFGLTVIEGAAAGLPVLVADLDGPREISDGGRYAYLFRPGDSRDCADKIVDIIQASRQPRFREILEDNRRELAKRYDITRTIANYRLRYQDLLKRRRPSSSTASR